MKLIFNPVVYRLCMSNVKGRVASCMYFPNLVSCRFGLNLIIVNQTCCIVKAIWFGVLAM